MNSPDTRTEETQKEALERAGVIEISVRQGRKKITFEDSRDLAGWLIQEAFQIERITNNSGIGNNRWITKLLSDLRSAAMEIQDIHPDRVPGLINRISERFLNRELRDSREIAAVISSTEVAEARLVAIEYLLNRTAVENGARTPTDIGYAIGLFVDQAHNYIQTDVLLKEFDDRLSQFESTQQKFAANEARIADARRTAEALVSRMDADWSATIEAYKAKAQLEGPRKFWIDKAEMHSKRGEVYRRKFMAALIGLISVLPTFAAGIIFWQWYFGTAPSGNGPDWASMHLNIEVTVILTTALALAIWYLKQLLRAWMSHEHLEEDARERLTLIDTFIGLKGANVEIGDLKPILDAIFRNATTGWIKEDTGPSTPVEIIMKTISEAASKRPG